METIRSRGLNAAAITSSISLIQTADGALHKTQTILQQMRELALQSANDTTPYTNRKEIQNKVERLMEELYRIAVNTEFHGQRLFDGSFRGKIPIGANEILDISQGINKLTANILGVKNDKTVDLTIHSLAVSPDVDIHNIAIRNKGQYTVEKLAENVAISSKRDTSISAGYVVKDKDGKIVGIGEKNGSKYYIADSSKNTIEGLEIKAESAVVDFETKGGIVKSGAITIFCVQETAKFIIVAAELDVTVLKGETELNSGTYTVTNSLGKHMQGLVDVYGNLVAITDGESNTIWKDLQDNELFKLASSFKDGDEITIQRKEGINISSQTAAKKAFIFIENAIETVSTERSKLCAYQNRLELMINNLSTSFENLSAVESRIHDREMAQKIMKQTKNSILAQASQAMSAQSHKVPQNVILFLQ